MKIIKLLMLALLVGLVLFAIIHAWGGPPAAFAEIKQPGFGTSIGIIPKLPKTPNDPILQGGHVYPNWGPPCQRYTYSTIYSDKEGRAPQYMKIYFNGQMINMTKADPKANDYKKGVKYEYKFVPNKLGSNFYYFEASNGKGKTRDSIIDSPDNGPVLFESAFDKNEIALIDPSSGKKALSYPTGKEWVGGVALSDDGKYLAAKTSQHVYLFDTSKPNKPLWEFNCEDCRVGEDVKGGVDISGDGSKIIAAIGETTLLFDKSSNKPIWKYQKNNNNSYNVAISRDGKYMAAATAGEESDQNSNLLILWSVSSGTPLWQYHASGNFHDVSLSDDGKFIAGATGCPDRRAYIFSRDSNQPVMRSEPLTYDSPISKSKISSDGSLAAFTTEGGPDSSVTLLFSKDSIKPLWKFEDGKQRAARGLGFSSDGKFVGAVTMAGDAYLFGKDNSGSPIEKWSLGKAMGALALSDDGSFLAVGGVDNKVRILRRNSKEVKETPFNEYLEELDISKNGKYIAAGTGGAIYFFESFANENKTFECKNVVEPPPESQLAGNFGVVDQGSPEMIAKNRGREPGLLEIIIDFIRNIFRPKSESTSLPDRQKPVQKQDNTSSSQNSAPSGKAVCGNNLCEPSLGETRQNCPQDCSASN